MIKLIGQWYDADDKVACSYPKPDCFLDENWGINERNKVVLYLKNGYPLRPIREGVIGLPDTWCRFACNTHKLRSDYYTDGIFIWQETLFHYIEKHNIRLPKEFEANALHHIPLHEKFVSTKFKRLALGFPIVEHKILAHYFPVEIDDTWWKQQNRECPKSPEVYHRNPKVCSISVRLYKQSNFEEQLQWLNKISLHEIITTDMLQVQDDEIYHIKLECVSEYDLEKYHTKLSQASIFYEKSWAFTGLP